jgi:DNA repair photolyase
MILSVSRRTDIPNYYSEWFLNRIKEGYLYVRNPMNIHQVSKIDISQENVDCIVFWTKNPERMLDKLEQLKDYKYYFQFTLTGYGKDMEPALPHKKDKMIPIFQRLSEMIGKEKVIWRYDPIVITETYSEEYHLKAFQEIASSLNGYCKRVVISFVDLYAKTKKNMKDIQTIDKKQSELITFLKKLAEIAVSNGMEIETCAELIDLSSCGIKHSSCIDKKLIENIIGCPIKVEKDKNQREECGCVESVEIGAYNTCLNGCKYCYANYNEERVKANRAMYDVHSPILCSKITEEDKITERAVKSIREGQISLFDLI